MSDVNKKRGRGRPAKPPEEIAESFTVRLTPADREHLAVVMDASCSSATDAIRVALGAAAMKVWEGTGELARRQKAELRKMAREDRLAEKKEKEGT